ncbi:MAG: NADH-quinone oxidoreductase subunit N [Oligoflexia bacterium]|nr:NADH-quinone oxidoreductase subunit N [Oligoflexia bacterium]
MLMLPELIVVVTAFALLVVDLLVSERRKPILPMIALAGIAAALVAAWMLPQSGQLLGGRFAVDSVSRWFRIIFLIAGGLTIAVSADSLNGRGAFRPAALSSRAEFCLILLFNLAGMLFLAGARDLVTLYVSLELATIPLFLLAAWRRDVESSEAGLKYVILGALGSAFLLYGLGVLYGLTGEMRLEAMSGALRAGPAFWLGVGMVVAGVGFKLTLVPFHLWAADVYQGAPTQVTAYLSVASKGAGLALLFHVLYRILAPLAPHWDGVIAVLAALTMTVGNFAAIVQKNIKRLMAFSAISQAGYLLLGFLGHDGAPGRGVAAMLFYLLVYVVTNLAAFAVIIWYSGETGREKIEDYRGLSKTHPLMALAMMVALFGLAGIPPLAGFVGKFFLFSVASKAGLHWLVGLAAINSTVSLYYYLGIVRRMYIEPAGAEDRAVRVSPMLATVLAITTLASVILGVVPVFFETISFQTADWLKGTLW